MKKLAHFDDYLPENIQEGISLLKKVLHRHPIPMQIFLLLCLNLIIAPAVYAVAGDDELTRKAAWALGLLGIVTIALSIYLFVVIFQPEKF
jgi:K+-transporting ATPase KdpF subunit